MGSCCLLLVVVNDHLPTIRMWLLTDETAILDNALITMEHLYRTGMLHVRLSNLVSQQLCFEITYSIARRPIKINKSNESDDGEADSRQDTSQERDTEILFTLSMSDISDHKRQLTFCNIDLQQHMIDKKILLEEQLKLLDTIENIYYILIKLEKAGHPNFQLKEYGWELYDQIGNILHIKNKQGSIFSVYL